MQFSLGTAAAAAFISYLLAGVIALGVALLIKVMSAVIGETEQIRRSSLFKRIFSWAYFKKSLSYFRE